MEVIDSNLYYIDKDKMLCVLDLNVILLTGLEKYLDKPNVICKDAKMICSNGQSLIILSCDNWVYKFDDLVHKFELDQNYTWTSLSYRLDYVVAAGHLSEKQISYVLIKVSSELFHQSSLKIDQTADQIGHIRLLETQKRIYVIVSRLKNSIDVLEIVDSVLVVYRTAVQVTDHTEGWIYTMAEHPTTNNRLLVGGSGFLVIVTIGENN